MHERIKRRQEKSKAFMEQSLEDTAQQIMRRHGVRLPAKVDDGLGLGDEDDDDDFSLEPGAAGGAGAGGAGAGRQGSGAGAGRGAYYDDDMGDDGAGVVDPEVCFCVVAGAKVVRVTGVLMQLVLVAVGVASAILLLLLPRPCW